jgi:hypothetical protein
MWTAGSPFAWPEIALPLALNGSVEFIWIDHGFVPQLPCRWSWAVGRLKDRRLSKITKSEPHD